MKEKSSHQIRFRFLEAGSSSMLSRRFNLLNNTLMSSVLMIVTQAHKKQQYVIFTHKGCTRNDKLYHAKPTNIKPTIRCVISQPIRTLDLTGTS